MPDHPARGAVDRFLRDFATDLQTDPDTRARVERLKNETLARAEVQDLIASVWGAVRAMLVAAAEDERSELRVRARAALLSLGGRLAADGRLRSKVDGWIEGAAAHLVTTYRGEITSLISETVASWDAEHTSRKIEAHIGRDLQFIRIKRHGGRLAGRAGHPHGGPAGGSVGPAPAGRARRPCGAERGPPGTSRCRNAGMPECRMWRHQTPGYFRITDATVQYVNSLLWF